MKRYIISLFLIVIAYSMTAQKNVIDSTSDTPDFNYPKTVITNSEDILNKAIKEDNNNDIVTALIQSSLAKSMISPDSLPTIVENISNVQDKITGPCIKASLYLLNATIINSYYSQNKYRINSRNNRNMSDSSDIFTWDSDQFKQKIAGLLDNALSFEKELKATPITTHLDFIEINQNSISTYPTMYDFIAYRSIMILNSWGTTNNWNPFIRNENQADNPYKNKIINIYNNLLSFHHNGSRAYIKATLDKYQFIGDFSSQKLDSLYNQYKDNADSAPILISLTQALTDKKEQHYLLQSYLNRFPDSDYSAQVKADMLTLELPSATVSFKSQYTSADSIQMKCCINNVNKLKVSIFDVSNKSYAGKKDFSNVAPIYQTELSSNGTIPFSDTIAITIPPLNYGNYTAIIDIFDHNGEKIKQANDFFSTFLVSDITSFSINNRTNSSRQIFAINAITGKPYKNVTIQSFTAGRNKQEFKQQTNANGFITANDSKFYDFNFIKANDKYYTEFIHKNTYIPDRNKYQTKIQVLTDLAIYRPGDTIRMAAVCYKVNSYKKEIISGEEFIITLYDTNRDSVSSAKVLSDEMGRITHNFIVPTDRMNGEFSLEIKKDNTEQYISKHFINVSEYKTPTYYVEFIDKKHTYNDSCDITLTGFAKTFSNVPIADADVQFTFETASWFNNFTSQATHTARTDEMGYFSVTINAKTLQQNMISPFTTYRVIATVTNDTGESQTGSVSFSLGSGIALLWEYDSNKLLNINATQKTVLPISISSAIDKKDIKCSLSLTSVNSLLTDTLHFSSDSMAIDFSKFKSGEYVLNIWADDDSSARIADKKIAIFRSTDKQIPVEVALWTPFENLTCIPGAKSEILIGSAYNDTHYYYVINYEDKIIEQGWKRLSKGLSKFKYSLPENAESNLVIQLYCVSELIPYQYNITIKPDKKEPEAIFEIESFRDKITVGEKEKWTLHFSIGGKSSPNSAIISSLTDAAINQLCNNTWNFSPTPYYIATAQALSPQNRYFLGNRINHFNWNSGLNDLISELRKYPTIDAPIFNLYGQSFFSSHIGMKGRSLTLANKVYVTVNNVVMEDEIKVESYQTLATEFSSTDFEELSTTESSLSSVTMRTADTKTVFWEPLLTTDDNGNCNIEFIVPDMNTTWRLQAVGYDKNLNSATLLKEIVSNKPIMVSPNMPRFLRQGDNATLMASILNSTDSVQSGIASIELFNPINNNIYYFKTFTFDLTANGTTPISVEYLIPDSISALGFRIKASNGKYSDGEQVMIPVLSSISPIIESKPFYINQGTDSYTLNLPDYPSKSTITFEYCDNPAWYIALALPALSDGSTTTATQLAHAIFANLTARKIAENHPEINDAITYWKKNPKDSVLVSMLEKNKELKIGTLLASPWLKESEAQTLRMSRLSDLFDKDLSESSTSKLIDKLAELQLDNGGFSWFKHSGAVASEATTFTILQLIGEMKAMGAIDNTSKLNEIALKAIHFIDRSIIERYNRQKDKLSFTGYDNYAYTRSLFLDVPMSITVKDLYDKITQLLTKEWKGMDIMNKAYTAITLANFGNTKVAKNILQSIRQFSIYSPSAGRYWDNFQNGWYQYCNKVTLTSLILQAYHKLEPQSKDIDQIRQWLLIEKQTTDWGNSSLAADAVYAILSTGSNWLRSNYTPTFTLNDKILTMNPIDNILGYGKIKLNIEGNSIKNTINIRRNANTPAWGAVYCQYSAPMNDIKASSISGLSISKDIISYKDNPDSWNVGDKVQIRLTIKNSRELEFVTVSDERAACLEPTEQISSYKFEDGLGYYMEIKDSETNLFFNYLPKGTHMITYDAYITNSGEFNCGIATLQCQYAPQNTAHSAGSKISVK